MFKTLFSGTSIGSMTVPNRIVMVAMGNYMAEPGGVVSDVDVAFYGTRAKGGVGLIVVESTTIDYEHAKSNRRQISVGEDDKIPGLKRLADAVHAHGAVIAAQINHPGRQGVAKDNGVASMPAPSVVDFQSPDKPIHEMSKVEISGIVARYGKAARRLKDAGFDAVEIHGAHGYLVCQFMSTYTNLRTDEYGGPFENRMRFVKEVYQSVRAACGSDFPVIVRISADENLWFAGKPGQGIRLADGVEIAKYLEKLGVDAISVSNGNFDTMNTIWEPVSYEEGWKTGNAEAVKKAVSVPVIAVSVIRNPDYAERILNEGKLDFIGSARQFLADPDWGVKAKTNRVGEIRRCISCLHCFETLVKAGATAKGQVACAINYQAGREEQYGDEMLIKNGNGRAVAIIGGGPSGMEAAIVLAKRGFRPVVYEKMGRLGGQLNTAALPPKKLKMLWQIEYQTAMLEKLGVEVRTDTAPTVEGLMALDPYAVFIAQGSKPLFPASIPGLDGDNVYSIIDILEEKVVFSDKNVVVIGSGSTGLETAEFLAGQGNTVAIYEMLEDIGPDLFFQNKIDIMGRLMPFKPGVFTKHRLVRIDGDTATFEDMDTGAKKETVADAFVISLGVAPSTELVDLIKERFDKVFVIGDAIKGGRLEPAISTAYEATFGLE